MNVGFISVLLSIGTIFIFGGPKRHGLLDIHVRDSPNINVWYAVCMTESMGLSSMPMEWLPKSTDIALLCFFFRAM